MTGDCHVRFCERLRGETPLCLLGERKKKKKNGSQRRKVAKASGSQTKRTSISWRLGTFARKKIPAILRGKPPRRTLLETNLLPQRIESNFLSLGSLKKSHIGTPIFLVCLCGFSSSLKNECFELLRFIQRIVGCN